MKNFIYNCPNCNELIAHEKCAITSGPLPEWWDDPQYCNNCKTPFLIPPYPMVKVSIREDADEIPI